MATPKKQSTTKSPVSSMGLTFESGNTADYPIAYSDNVWDIAVANTQLALKLGNSGQFDQHTINEDLAAAAQATTVETVDTQTWKILGGSVAALAAGIVVAIFYRKH